MPHAASLVRSVVINGDGAHGPNIYRLLRQAYQTQHILFFDFELGSALEEHTLCTTIPLQNLTSLSFSVLPPGFMDKVLSTCSHNIKALRMYRVNLAAVDMQPWRDEKPRWHLPKLRALSLKHVGNIPPPVFNELITNTSSHLRCLKIHYEDSHEVCRSQSMWAECRFDVLERLELGSFESCVVSKILANNGDALRCLHTLRLPLLKGDLASVPTLSENTLSNDKSQCIENDQIQKTVRRSILRDIPTSVQVLEFQGCEDSSLCYELPDYLEEHPSWLPLLRICPTLTVGGKKISDHELAILRIAYFAAARKSGLRMPEGSQYYALNRSR